MAWLRIDDGFPENRKILALPRRDRWTWLEVLAYCARQTNRGELPNNISDIVRHATPAFVRQAAEAGLLDMTDTGYVVHDWDEYNPRDPTGATRQMRYRNRSRNADVTENVTEENVTDVTPPRARASRPVPNPSIHKPFLPSNGCEAGKEGGVELGEDILRSIT